MKARARTAVATLAFLGAAAAAVLYAWYGVEKKGEAEASRKEREGRLFAFEPAQVRELLVEAKGGSTRLTRGGPGQAWRLPALNEDADRGAVDSLVDHLARLQRKSEVAAAPEASALAGFGLEKPRVVVEAGLEGGRKEILRVGDRSAFDGSLYVRVGSGPVFLVPGDVEWWLDKGQDDLRDRTVLHFEPEAVKGLRVEAAGKVAWAAQRRPQKEGAAPGWDLIAPKAARAQADRIDSALRTLSWLRALRFADDAGRRVAELGLDRPRRAFVLLGEGGKEMGRIELGAEPKDSAYARSSASPRILEIDRSALGSIPAAAADVEEKPPPPAPPAPPAPAAPQGGAAQPQPPAAPAAPAKD